MEIGCGSGGVLLEYMVDGANPYNLFGLDILFNRLDEAKSKIPAASILNANGEFVPFDTSSFDIVLQYTAFSSILDDKIKKNMAQEMLRVLNPDSFILWYDFWLKPTNKQKESALPRFKNSFQIVKFNFEK